MQRRLRRLRAAGSGCSVMLEESALFAARFMEKCGPRLASDLLRGGALSKAVGLLRRVRRAGAPPPVGFEPWRVVAVALHNYDCFPEARLGQPWALLSLEVQSNHEMPRVQLKQCEEEEEAIMCTMHMLLRCASACFTPVYAA